MKWKKFLRGVSLALAMTLVLPATQIYAEDTGEERWVSGDYVYGYGQAADMPAKFHVVGYKGNESSITIPQKIDGVTMQYIDAEAFLGLDCLEEVELPVTISGIYDEAFEDCTNLKSIHMPSVIFIGKKVFSECISLETIELPDELREIADFAFENCVKLESITIPENVNIIGKQVFLGCSSLKEINVSSKNTAYQSVDGILYDKNLTKMLYCPQAKTGNITIPATVTDVSEVLGGDFSNNRIEPLTGVTNIFVEEGNEYFSSKDGVLYNKDQTRLIYCPPGKSGKLTIPATVKEIGNYIMGFNEGYWVNSAFYGCKNLTAIEVPTENTVYNSREDVLYSEDMTKLLYIPEAKTGTLTIPASLKEFGQRYIDIDNFDISGNNQLSEFIVEEGAFYFEAVDGILYGNKGKYLVKCPGKKTGDIRVPDKVSYILPEAFEGCTGITSVSISSPWVSVEHEAFKGCTELKEFKLPASVKELGDKAFLGCSNLETIVAEGVDRIGTMTFKDCVNLKNITLAENLKVIHRSAFENCKSIKTFSLGEELLEYFGLGASTFEGCTSLEAIAIPSGVEEIPNYAFKGCTALKDVTIAEGIKRVRKGAFQNCTSLEKITIPSTATFILSAFCGCSSLKKAVIKTEIPYCMHVYGSQFHGCDKDLLLVVKENSSVEDFAKSWGYNYRYIQPEDEETVYTISGKIENGKEFTIQPVEEGIFTVNAGENYVFKIATENKDCITVFANNTKLTPDEEGVYTIQSVKADQVITCTFTAHSYGDWHTLKEASCMQTGKKQGSCQVCGYIKNDVIPATKNISACSINGIEASYTYTGVEIKPEITLLDGTIEVPKEAYGVTYTNNSEVGTATITVAGAGGYTGKITKTFVIEKSPEETNPNPPEETNPNPPEETDPPGVTNTPEKTNPNPPEETDTSQKIKPSGETEILDEGDSETEIVIENNEKNEVTVGTKITDGKTKAIYKVTSVKTGKKTVTYVKPLKKTYQKVSIQNTVTLNGTKYSVTAISADAFYKNTKLQQITIPKNVKSIGNRAFYGCKKLKKITIKSTSLTKEKMGKNAFGGIHEKSVIKVPKKCLKNYKEILRARGVSKKASIKKI